ncbi:MAG: heavy metal translocating P-type ATPase [Acidimicrobiales bacterium]
MTDLDERADHDGDEAPDHLWESREVRWSALSGVLLAVGFVADQFGATSTVVTATYVASTLAGIRFFAREGLEELWREREVGIELLMTVAALVAGVLGLWGEAATLAFLYSISESLEEFTEDRTRGAIRALMDLAPKRVQRLRADGSTEEIGLDDVAVGDRFLVRPGEGIATDGEVLDGQSAVDEAAITGESIPVEKDVGSSVFAGTLNAQGALVVRATATAADNTLAKIVHLVTEAQARKGRGEQFMVRFSRTYSPAVLATGVLVAVAGGLVGGDWSQWLERAATVVVAAAPCALVISIPVTYVAAIGNAGRKGVLIKGGIYLEELARVQVVAMDKTGTLTRGTPRLVELRPAPGIDEDGLLALAAAVETRSEHPLARAITAAATERAIAVSPVEAFESLPGAGAAATVDGTRYLIGSPEFIDQQDVALDGFADAIPQLQSQGATVVVLAAGTTACGLLAIADTVRAEAPDAIAALHQLGVQRVSMLTGDNPRTAAAVTAQVGADDFHAGLKPEDKAAKVAELEAAHGHVLMVGDGVNDAPALAAAAVGVAMGAAGSDVALETADVALMADDLTKLAEAVRIGRRTRRIVRQNLTLSLVILAVLVPGALAGVFTLPVAVLAHEISELVVIANGIRMAKA